MKLVFFFMFLFSAHGLFPASEKFCNPFKPQDLIGIKKDFGRSNYVAVSCPPKKYNGIHFELKNKSRVYAISNGKVVAVSPNENRGFGKSIAISFQDSLVVTYYHLDSIFVAKRQKVNRGTELGISGSTGYTTVNGVGIRITSNGSIVDPNLYLK